MRLGAGAAWNAFRVIACPPVLPYLTAKTLTGSGPVSGEQADPNPAVLDGRMYLCYVYLWYCGIDSFSAYPLPAALDTGVAFSDES